MKPKKINTVKSSAETMELRELLDNQREYKRTFLSRLYTQAEINEIRKQLKSEEITMQWYGQPFPKDILACEHDIKLDTYRDLVIQENKLKKALENKGLNKKKLDKLIQEGVYVKETKESKKKMDYVG